MSSVPGITTVSPAPSSVTLASALNVTSQGGGGGGAGGGPSPARASRPSTTAAPESGGADASNLEALTRDMFGRTAEYIRGELRLTAEDYRLLQAMNEKTAEKYSGMTSMAAALNKSITQLNDKQASLQPYLNQIDQIETMVEELESTAMRLDQYSRRLEAKFKKLEKR